MKFLMIKHFLHKFLHQVSRGTASAHIMQSSVQKVPNICNNIVKVQKRNKKKEVVMQLPIASQIDVAAPLLETGLIINSFKSFSAHFLLDYITKAEF